MAIRDELLKTILSKPSAPFREAHVIAAITRVLDDAGVPWFSDPIGNLVLGVASRREYLALAGARTAEPLRVYIAHMDHPGFHGVEWKSDTELEVKWHGGSPTQHIDGSKVWLATRQGSIGHGRFKSHELTPTGRAIARGVVEFPADARERAPDARGLYGGFAFRAPVWQEGELLYTKAADDLVGSFAILSLALDLFGSKGAKSRRKASGARARPPFLGLLTRAEEVGFIGAIGHFEQGWLAKAKRPVLGVSLETSRTLPGADVGKGPVVRLGDRYTVFDAAALRVFTELAQKTLPDRHQRRIMDGGTCEATAATVYGFPCVGISVPLGNYHNQSFEGGPDSAGPLGPAPEFVHQGDVEGLLELCRALLKPKLPWQAPWGSRLKEFRKDLRGYRPLLRSGP